MDGEEARKAESLSLEVGIDFGRPFMRRWALRCAERIIAAGASCVHGTPAERCCGGAVACWLDAGTGSEQPMRGVPPPMRRCGMCTGRTLWWGGWPSLSSTSSSPR